MYAIELAYISFGVLLASFSNPVSPTLPILEKLQVTTVKMTSNKTIITKVLFII